MSELDIIRKYEQQNEVVDLYVKGHRPSEIQQRLGLTRKAVDMHLGEFKEYAKQNKVIRERAQEVVIATDVHYSSIIKEMYEAVSEAQLNSDYKAQMTGLKMIADAEAKKVELLAKAGLLADNAVGDQIAEMEENQKILVGILRNISSRYPKIGMEIATELRKVTGKAEGIVVERVDG